MSIQHVVFRWTWHGLNVMRIDHPNFKTGTALKPHKTDAAKCRLIPVRQFQCHSALAKLPIHEGLE
jgi:hypothetical protein